MHFWNAFFFYSYDYTQEKLAELIECSSGTIASIEVGTVGMSTETLLALCRLLKTTPNEVLLGNVNDEHAWLTDQLMLLTPEQRKVAIDIISPYIQSVLHPDAK